MKELVVLCKTRRRKSLQKGLSLRQRRRESQSCRQRDVASPLQIGIRTTIDAFWVTKTWQKLITKTSFQIPTLGLIVSCQNWNTLAVEARVVSERRSKETCVKICLKNHICLSLRCFVKQKHCKQYHEVFYSTRFFCQIRNGDKSQRRPRISSQFSRFFCKFAYFCLYQKTT